MAKQKVTEEDVKHLAKLSNLELSSEEIVKFAEILTDTLEHINVLDELDTSEIEGTYQVTGMSNVFMDTTLPSTTLPQEEVLKNAKETIDSKIATEAVFDRE